MTEALAETYAPIFPGTRSQWIQLDPSWKRAEPYTKTDQYISVNSTVNATELQDGATANATINETEGYIQGINTSFIEDYLNSHINVTELQNITVDFFIPDEVMPPEEVYLPFSMQFDYNRSYEYTTLPEALKWKIGLALFSNNTMVLFYKNNLTEMAGLPFAVDFVPTTANDSQNMQNSSIPAYEINVTPQIWLNSTHVNGTPVPYGSNFSAAFSMSLINTTYMTKQLYAGEKSAIVIDAPKTEFVSLNLTYARFNDSVDSWDNDTYVREFLHLLGSQLFYSADSSTDIQADSWNTRWARVKPSVAFVTNENRVETFGGTPISVSPDHSTSVDIKVDQIVSSLNEEAAFGFNFERGLMVSGIEGSIFETFFNTVGISTGSILSKANDEGIPLFFIDNETIDRFDSLNIPQSDVDLLRGLIQQDPYLFVIVPQNTTSFGNWTGTGYMIIDSRTGGGKYLISGGLSGGTGECTDTQMGECFKQAACAFSVGIGIPVGLVLGVVYAAPLFGATVSEAIMTPLNYWVFRIFAVGAGEIGLLRMIPKGVPFPTPGSIIYDWWMENCYPLIFGGS